jgi:hypothetical protein
VAGLLAIPGWRNVRNVRLSNISSPFWQSAVSYRRASGPRPQRIVKPAVIATWAGLRILSGYCILLRVRGAEPESHSPGAEGEKLWLWAQTWTQKFLLHLLLTSLCLVGRFFLQSPPRLISSPDKNTLLISRAPCKRREQVRRACPNFPPNDRPYASLPAVGRRHSCTRCRRPTCQVCVWLQPRPRYPRSIPGHPCRWDGTGHESNGMDSSPSKRLCHLPSSHRRARSVDCGDCRRYKV